MQAHFFSPCKGRSASRELLVNLNGQGWTLAELAQTARKAGILAVVEILATFCEEEGMNLYGFST